MHYLVIGEPYDDAKGRRRIGGGINVPVNAGNLYANLNSSVTGSSI